MIFDHLIWREFFKSQFYFSLLSRPNSIQKDKQLLTKTAQTIFILIANEVAFNLVLVISFIDLVQFICL